jgi:hypothetical protein
VQITQRWNLEPQTIAEKTTVFSVEMAAAFVLRAQPAVATQREE